jgi:hypothetical protein
VNLFSIVDDGGRERQLEVCLNNRKEAGDKSLSLMIDKRIRIPKG